MAPGRLRQEHCQFKARQGCVECKWQPWLHNETLSKTNELGEALANLEKTKVRISCVIIHFVLLRVTQHSTSYGMEIFLVQIQDSILETFLKGSMTQEHQTMLLEIT